MVYDMRMETDREACSRSTRLTRSKREIKDLFPLLSFFFSFSFLPSFFFCFVVLLLLPVLLLSLSFFVYSENLVSTCTLGCGAGEALPRKAERRPECGERPPWPVGPSQTVRRTDRCRGRSPPCCRRHRRLHLRRRRFHPLRPCTASRRPRAPTDLGNPGCTLWRRRST